MCSLFRAIIYLTSYTRDSLNMFDFSEYEDHPIGMNILLSKKQHQDLTDLHQTCRDRYIYDLIHCVLLSADG